jgi:hypothetical protein
MRRSWIVGLVEAQTSLVGAVSQAGRESRAARLGYDELARPVVRVHHGSISPTTHTADRRSSECPLKNFNIRNWDSVRSLGNPADMVPRRASPKRLISEDYDLDHLSAYHLL